jgi:methylated-DNA-[protein]-cysteine S-methyltransferase
MGIAASEKGVVTVVLPCPSEQEVLVNLGNNLFNAARSNNLLSNLVERLKLYFRGVRVDFPDKLDFTGATPFQSRIWQTARLIPYGETRSYGWVAQQAGNPKASRAAGQALGRNPLPIIVPCHRVIAGDGGLGGFTGGLQVKKQLLALESTGK